MELRGVDGQQEVEVFEVAKEREKYRLPIEEGYVIRCHDLSYDSTYYRGKNLKGSYYRDKIPMEHTYTMTGAKKAVTYLQRFYSDQGRKQYSIECVGDCYETWLYADSKNETAEIIDTAQRALNCLRELMENNNFRQKDKKRIAEVKQALEFLEDKSLEKIQG